MGTREIIKLHKEVHNLITKADVPSLAIVAILESEKQRVLCTTLKANSMMNLAKGFSDRQKVLEEEMAKSGVS